MNIKNNISGWSFPVMADSRTGKIKTTGLKEDIQQSLIILISTEQGERLLHPDYGCRMRRFMFEPVSYELIKGIREEVYRSIIKWEKRIQNVEVNILNDVEEETTLIISISYIIPFLMEADNINYMYSLR